MRAPAISRPDVPYRIDIPAPPDLALDRLVELGALDVEPVAGGLAALMPDGVSPDTVAGALGGAPLTCAPATARDDGSVWLLAPRAVRVSRVVIASSGKAAAPGELRLLDAAAFGTGHHPTTRLCLEALQDILSPETPGHVLDVGTGSGILALAALSLGAPRAVGLDIDAEALETARENARLNGLAHRLLLLRGGPDAVSGTWPLVLANVLAAPLIEMAPVLARRVAKGGSLILSGISVGVEADVRRAYQRLGMHLRASEPRGGWVALVARASW